MSDDGRAIFDYPRNKLSITTYRPPGPVAEAFLKDRENRCKMIKGPMGSGKTMTLLFDGLSSAAQMPKCTAGPYKGHRVYRDCVMRDTYANLWDSTIPSWFQWFDEDTGNWTGSQGRQAIHRLHFDAFDGGKILYELHFRAVQDRRIENVLKGTEYTRYALEEADQFSPDVMPFVLQRAMQERFPPKSWFPDGTMYHGHVSGSFNPTDPENYLFETFEVKQLKGHKLYSQPSGRSANGENHAFVKRSQYIEQAEINAHQPWYVRRNIDGLWGYSRDGKPVFDDEYDDEINCSDEDLKPIPGVGLLLGFDQDVRGPAMIVAQEQPNTGQLRVLAEVVPMMRCGATKFASLCRGLLQSEGFRDCPIKVAVADPSAWAGSDTEHGDFSWAETVQRQLGIVMQPAETNALDMRLDAVRQLLLARPTPRTPGLIISKGCPVVRKAFMSHYQYKTDNKHQLVGGTRLKPVKNEYSDPMDALQYICLQFLGLQVVMTGELTRNPQRLGGDNDDDDDDSGSTVMQSNFSVFG